MAQNPPFHYALRIRIVQKNADNELEFFDREEVFSDNQPIIARARALDRYQTYADVITNCNNISHRKAEEIFDELNIKEINLSRDAGTGIGVFMIIDTPIKPVIDNKRPSILNDLDDLLSQFENELFIHGIGNIGYYQYNPRKLLADLESELKYYNHYQLDKRDSEVSVSFCDEDEWEEGYLGDGKWEEGYFEPNDHIILETPFDWKDYKQPYWWGHPDPSATFPLRQSPWDYSALSLEQQRLNLIDLINQGENNIVEFKPALLHNFNTGKPGISTKSHIAKAICAFANSNGGILFIGISDTGKSQGLEFDFKHAGSKKPKDFFLLEFDQMISYFFHPKIRSVIQTNFIKYENKEVFYVSVSPLKSKAIFMKGQEPNEKIFYIRGEASSRKIDDVEEIVDYCMERYGIHNNE